jgi:hypothetical protein
MGIYKKGQRFAGPYSAEVDPDFQPSGDNLKMYPSKSAGAGSMNTTGGDPFKAALDVSAFVDPQAPYATKFDQGGGNWNRDKSDSGLGGATGPLPKSSSHPKAGGINGKKTS